MFCLKQHVAHIKVNVSSCEKSNVIDKIECKRALKYVKRGKENKRKALKENRTEVNIIENNKEVDDCVEIVGVSRKAPTVGPVDQFARAISSSGTKKDNKI